MIEAAKKAPQEAPDVKDESDNSGMVIILVIVGAVVLFVILVTVVIIIAVSASKKKKKKMAALRAEMGYGYLPDVRYNSADTPSTYYSPDMNGGSTYESKSEYQGQYQEQYPYNPYNPYNPGNTGYNEEADRTRRE